MGYYKSIEKMKDILGGDIKGIVVKTKSGYKVVKVTIMWSTIDNADNVMSYATDGKRVYRVNDLKIKRATTAY